MFDKYGAEKIVKLYLEKYDLLKSIQPREDGSLPDVGGACDLKSMLNIYIEPTNLCNLSCVFCARENMRRGTMHLRLDGFQRALRDLPAGSYITMTGNGEPLLNPDIYEMIASASGAGMYVSMITNATALNERNQDRLIDSGVSRVQISFQSLDRDTYGAIMRNANFERTLENVLGFIKKVREREKKIFISISTVKVKEGEKYAAVSKRFWEKMPIDNYYEGELLSLQSDSAEYEQCVIDEQEEYLPCANPWIDVKINADGAVIPCVQDFSCKYTIGNIYKNTLLEILNGEEAKRFRCASLHGDMEFLDKIGYHCGQCNTWREKVGGSIGYFLEKSFPIRLGLVVDEIAGGRPGNTEFLEC